MRLFVVFSPLCNEHGAFRFNYNRERLTAFFQRPRQPASRESRSSSSGSSSRRNSDGSLTCGLCGQTFKSTPALNGHMRVHSSSDKKVLDRDRFVGIDAFAALRVRRAVRCRQRRSVAMETLGCDDLAPFGVLKLQAVWLSDVVNHLHKKTRKCVCAEPFVICRFSFILSVAAVTLRCY